MYNTFRGRSFAAATLFALAMPMASVAQTEFQGGGFMTDFTPACAAQGFQGTGQVMARVRPAELPGNSPTENIVNLSFGNYVMHLRFPQEPFGGTETEIGEWTTATAFAEIGGGFGLNPSVMPQLRELPDPIGTVLDPGNEFHTIIELRNFARTPGCEATISIWARRN